ncbi:MAG: hypothetical protein KM310_11360 [Clostridiales bacterium]|nr:hypothetical protein [Clostridiales bacterium]
MLASLLAAARGGERRECPPQHSFPAAAEFTSPFSLSALLSYVTPETVLGTQLAAQRGPWPESR